MVILPIDGTGHESTLSVSLYSLVGEDLSDLLWVLRGGGKPESGSES